MKKYLILCFVGALLLAGCNGEGEEVKTTQKPAVTTVSSPLEEKDGVYIITEENFYPAVAEIYGNPLKYEGKRIRFEGEYIAEMDHGEMFFQVYRKISVTERHTDDDGHVHTHVESATPVGFRIVYDGNKPTNKTFVTVEGTVELYDSDGGKALWVIADTLEKCENPGKVFLEF